MDRKTRILLVEDDHRLAELIREYLRGHDYEVLVEHRGDTVPDRIPAVRPDLLILDLMLPGLDGLSICRSVRPHFAGPILILTAREDDMDHVAGLEMGADDYVRKPVDPRVLLARIRALLRRVEPSEMEVKDNEGDLVFGELQISPRSHSVKLSGVDVDLGSSEFELLLLLARNADKVLDRDRIFTELRGILYDGLDRYVDITILRLRKKLERNPGRPKRIRTIYRQGYLFASQAWRVHSS